MRWTKRRLIILTVLVWAITFGIIVPLMAQKWVFSPFFSNSNDFHVRASKFVDKLNADRYKLTERYLKRIDSETNKDVHTKHLPTATMVTVIITKRRKQCRGREFDCEPHYLQQVVAALDEEMKFALRDSKDKRERFVPIVICNVDRKPNEQLDFSLISEQFPTILRYGNESHEGVSGIVNSRSQESLDYAFCLESILKLSSPKYLMVLEDDAVAFNGIFEKIFYLLDNRVEHKPLRGSMTTDPKRWGWIKLYYPEIWGGFGFEESKIFELFWIAVFGAGAFGLLCLALVKPKPHFRFILSFSMVGSLFLLALVLIMTRQTFLEMRRLHSFFYHITPDRGCCTQTVLYSTKWITEIVKYIRSSECERCHLGVDLALSDFAEMNYLPCFLVEPNLVRHIGMHSTLTSDKDPRSFLFYDFLYTEISNLIVGL
ncbi:post-GPI attachment to proteins factor 4-like [Bradysia coprophila]|uniref:post-GPI attachment to proteins factor 4-like n=1 Tax=Bradysia coprophila TaxID=38358 RepID=UPI00187DAECF|nr:post-GPI attachment to proteins factor 4-like [Bradysia coprophila]